MNTLFIYVSPNNGDSRISDLIENNFWLIDKKCQQWSVDFFFFPILFKALDHEKIYEVWPMMRGLSINEIYERTILAFLHKLTITEPGIIVVRDDYPSEFIELPKNDFMLAWDYILSQYGKCDDSWNKYKPHRGRNEEDNLPKELFEFKRGDGYTKTQNVYANLSPDEQKEVREFYLKYATRFNIPYLKRCLNIDDNLSNIAYSFKQRSFHFVSYNKTVKLEPTVAIFFLLLLKHPEGIKTRELSKYKDEISKYYDYFECSGNSFLDDVVTPKDTARNSYISKLKRKLLDELEGIVDDETILDYGIESSPETDENGGKIKGGDIIYSIYAAGKIGIKEVQ